MEEVKDQEIREMRRKRGLKLWKEKHYIVLCPLHTCEFRKPLHHRN
jgi:hypothetical protein